MAEESTNVQENSSNSHTGTLNNDIESPTTPDSCCNDSGIDKSDIKSDSLGSASSLSSHETGHDSMVNGRIESTQNLNTDTNKPQTSSPLCVSTRKGNVRFDVDQRNNSLCSFISDVSNNTSVSLDSRDVLNPEEVRVPIMGYEIMEERAKFTVS